MQNDPMILASKSGFFFSFLFFSFWGFVFMNKNGPVGTHPSRLNSKNAVITWSCLACIGRGEHV